MCTRYPPASTNFPGMAGVVPLCAAANVPYKNRRQMTKARAVLGLLCVGILALWVGCSRKDVSVLPSTPQVSRNNRSYIDLEPGMGVRLVIPLLKSGEFLSDLGAQKTESNTISLRASNLIGYTNSSYTVTGKPGRVRLTFVAAQEMRDG